MIRGTRVILSASLVAASALAADGVMFAYRFEADASDRYRVSLSSSMDMGGMEIVQAAEIEATVKCLSVVDGKSAMVITFDKVETSRTMMGKMESDPMGAMVQGRFVNFSVDAHGEVTDVTPDAKFESWAEARDLVESLLRGWYEYLPAADVSVGGEWKDENRRIASASGAETVANRYYKFKELRKEMGRECAAVEQRTEVAVGGTRETPMGAFVLSGAGKGKFEFLYDIATTRIIRLKGTQDVDIDMTPLGGGEAIKTAVSNHIERRLLE
jgi:hypothetical protein